MTVSSEIGVPPLPRTAQGIACVLAGMVLFVGQDVLMKDMLSHYPVWMLIFVRSIVALMTLLPLVLWLGAPHRIFTPLWPWYLARAMLFASGFAMFYSAFPFMGLAEVTTLFFSAPLMTAALAALFLHEKIGLHRAAALLVGFAGVVIAMNPAGDSFGWIAILPLLCALTYAISQAIVRKIGEQDTSLTIGLYTISFSGLLIVPIGFAVSQMIVITPELSHLRMGWPVPPAEGVAMLALLGSIGTVAYTLVSRAYQIANASVIAPFDYSYLPLAAALGYLLWGEVPPYTTFIGMVLIVASGLYTAHRELRVNRAEADNPPIAQTVFTPGAPAAVLEDALDGEAVELNESDEKLT
ncbi:DMT family transporter [Leisingera sp. ANG59]|uniref:DMT family transporter n=1 Tax=Leisingera sp. ANG59 TaxID=2675221 RepID=UPI0015722F8F|nr:DMT family transporter [Leisingera sp. ANG59]NSY41409.1 EamA family transporter [Leisingera sp. ANG59]